MALAWAVRVEVGGSAMRPPYPYPCRGAIYATQREAHESIEVAKHERDGSFFLVETPYVYRCVEGHFHVFMEWYARP